MTSSTLFFRSHDSKQTNKDQKLPLTYKALDTGDSFHKYSTNISAHRKKTSFDVKRYEILYVTIATTDINEMQCLDICVCVGFRGQRDEGVEGDLSKVSM